MLVFKGLEAPAMALGGLLNDASVLLGQRRDGRTDLRDLSRLELEGPVERGDLDLDLVDRIVPSGARTAVAALASDTAEVLIDAADPAVLAVDEARAALVTRQAALEVVVVLSVAVSGGALGVES
ncbi:MAG: hypothetical protein ABSG93_15190 [Solirubrobacteraceae bacterium]